uniref:Uncharacterized protein n=1 Tax=Arundo donax TaxID=35708 RepID=A0A0A9BCB8_ARUDO
MQSDLLTCSITYSHSTAGGRFPQSPSPSPGKNEARVLGVRP